MRIFAYIRIFSHYNDRLFIKPYHYVKIYSYVIYGREFIEIYYLWLLYYSQGISYAVSNHALFEEDCEAWVHGPVYRKVYDIFKEFRYNPIDDPRFIIIKEHENILSDSEKNTIDLVLSTFGMYGGKNLENITHKESPWIDAREGHTYADYSNAILTKDSIKSYFTKINNEYNISTKDGINNYIQNMLFNA